MHSHRFRSYRLLVLREAPSITVPSWRAVHDIFQEKSWIDATVLRNFGHRTAAAKTCSMPVSPEAMVLDHCAKRLRRSIVLTENRVKCRMSVRRKKQDRETPCAMRIVKSPLPFKNRYEPIGWVRRKSVIHPLAIMRHPAVRLKICLSEIDLRNRVISKKALSARTRNSIHQFLPFYVIVHIDEAMRSLRGIERSNRTAIEIASGIINRSGSKKILKPICRPHRVLEIKSGKPIRHSLLVDGQIFS